MLHLIIQLSLFDFTYTMHNILSEFSTYSQLVTSLLDRNALLDSLPLFVCKRLRPGSLFTEQSQCCFTDQKYMSNPLPTCHMLVFDSNVTSAIQGREILQASPNDEFDEDSQNEDCEMQMGTILDGGVALAVEGR